MMEKEPKEQEANVGKILPIAWPEDVPATYANNVLAQKDNGMLVLSFFQVPPPYLIALTDDAREKMINELTCVNAITAAKVVLPMSVVPALLRVIQTHMEPTSETGDTTNGNDPT